MQTSTRPAKGTSVDEYIASFPADVQERLKKLRAVIREAAPEAEESITYGMPAFKLNGPLVYFAAFKAHIGFYPTASGISSFKKELSAYKQGKGSVQFPLDEPMPLDLVKRIVEFKVAENKGKKSKSKK